MFTKIAIGFLIFSILGGTASGMSLLPKFGGGKTVIPMSESKSERSIRCKGEVEINDKGRIVKCSEGFYLDEESENKEERKMNAKERFLGWLGNFKGFFFWLVLGSIAASFLGFGGLVTSFWSNLFGSGIKISKAMIRGIKNIKRNGKDLKGKDKERYDTFVKELMGELEKEQLREGVQKKVNKLRADIEK